MEFQTAKYAVAGAGRIAGGLKDNALRAAIQIAKAASSDESTFRLLSA